LFSKHSLERPAHRFLNTAICYWVDALRQLFDGQRIVRLGVKDGFNS
jgi:hypothetical protein